MLPDSSLCPYCKNLHEKGERGLICQPTDPNPCEPCLRIAELDERILELTKERRKLQSEANANHDKLLQIMPREVVAEIFKFNLPDDIMSLNLVDATSIRTIGAPLVLSAVCRQWRAIAHSIPQLWAEICLRLPQSEANTLSPLPTLAREWIRRSHDCPLLINLCTLGSSQDTWELMQVIDRSTARLREFRYSGHPKFLGNFFNDTGVRPLQTLVLSTPLHTPPISSINQRNHILQITRLEMDNIPSPGAVNFVNWEHLTELRLYGDLPVAECLEMLRRSPNLLRCTLKPRNVERAVEEFVLPQKPFLHNSIVDLTLVTNIYSDIFSHLICPSLTKLTVSTIHQRDIVPINFMVKFIQRSQCPLTTLVLKDVILKAIDVKMLFKGVPDTLCQLELQTYRTI